jgi:hypothetical protein
VYYYRADWHNLGTTAGYNALAASIRQKMMQALIAPGTGFAPKGGFWGRNYGERLPVRGGNWTGGSAAGVAALNLDARRSFAPSDIGFRVAFGV